MAHDAQPGDEPSEPTGAMSRDRFAQTVIDRVRRRFPLVKIGRAPQSFSVRVNGQVASLEHLYRIAKLKPGDLQHQVERWAVELLRAGEGTPDRRADLDEVRERILPVLIPMPTHEADDVGEDLDESPEHDKAVLVEPKLRPTKPDDALASRPLVPGLRVGYVIDGDRTISYVPRKLLRRWGLDLDELDALAMDNLQNRSEQMSGHAAHDDEGDVSLILFQRFDGFDASRLLLPGLQRRLREVLGNPYVAAVPNRDILLCFREDVDTIHTLQRQIRYDHATRPHQISPELFLVTLDGISPYDPPDLPDLPEPGDTDDADD